TPIWLAPQTQRPDVIWPGFSTEDPNLRGTTGPGGLAVTLDAVEGPGNVEIYMQDGPTANRVFSSVEPLPAWTMGEAQHTHMNWAFGAPGTYRLTFSMSGVVGGRQQSATNDYLFVVGDLAAHTRSAAVELTASAVTADAGEAVLLTGRVTPADAVGAVQF